MFTQDPTPEDLAAIAAEWPLIEAELAVVAAECRLAVWHDAVAIRAHRRAVNALAAVVRERFASTATPTIPARPVTAA